MNIDDTQSNNETILLLTSCAHPQLSFSGNISEREKEYVNTVEHYLNTTTFRIVFIDNSNWDLAEYIKDERLQSLCFDSGDDAFRKGKGYGEASGIQFAFEHSEWLRSCRRIVKITGRHVINNMPTLLRQSKNMDAAYIDVKKKFGLAESFFFIAPPMFFTDYLLPNKDLMNDNEHVYFEHVLASCTKKWITDGHSHSMFREPIYIIGHPGGNPKPYEAPSFERYFLIFAKYCLYETLKKTKLLYASHVLSTSNKTITSLSDNPRKSVSNDKQKS